MSNGGAFGWLGAAGSMLGVVSTAIGIWVAVATQQLEATSDQASGSVPTSECAGRGLSRS
jgi:hypothetical protein